MPPRRARPDRADRILDAAGVVFARDGFAAARMEDVAAEAGVSKGALYLSFDSKDALIDALVERMVGWEVRRLEEATAAEGSVRDRLVAFVRGYAHDMAEVADLAPVILDVYARAGRSGAVRDTLSRSFRAYVEALAEFIRRGVATGELAVADPDRAAVEIAAMMEGVGLLWLIDPDGVHLVDVAEHGVLALLDAMSPRGRAADQAPSR
jgi:AcrR family transcriptional regulator